MIERISRYLVIFISILIMAVYIPKFYRMAFERTPKVPYLAYSILNDDFLSIGREDGKVVRKDTKGKYYNREEYELALPFIHFRQLASKGLLADTICGIAINLAEFRREGYAKNFGPKDINKPAVSPYPLFESELRSMLLAVPDDFFCINEGGIEFVTVSTNKLHEEKSRLFTEAMKKEGFVFPARIISGLTAAKKKSEEGYFITDSTGQLYHLKMERGKPYCRNLLLPEEINLRHIECVDLTNREYYAYLVTTDNNIYVLETDTYKLVKLPISDYKPDEHKVRLNANIDNKTILLVGENHIIAYAVDRDYQFLKRYEEKWDGYAESYAGKIAAILFPFEVKLQERSSSFINFYFTKGSWSYGWIIHLLLIGLMISLVPKKDRNLLRIAFDLVIILSTGVFGFIAVNIFPNRF